MDHPFPSPSLSSQALAALDLLSITNFVNYFGKQDKVDDVCVKPILMQKGTTKLALYGLGNIRDERLNRMWTKQKVKFLRPPESEGRDSFFNILVLHQNRAEGRGRKNAIFESMIPDWFDVVVWGHEHECQTGFQVGFCALPISFRCPHRSLLTIAPAPASTVRSCNIYRNPYTGASGSSSQVRPWRRRW
jgi:DNA repair exonuclease SbcCD nuclease subunit